MNFPLFNCWRSRTWTKSKMKIGVMKKRIKFTSLFLYEKKNIIERIDDEKFIFRNIKTIGNQ